MKLLTLLSLCLSCLVVNAQWDVLHITPHHDAATYQNIEFRDENFGLVLTDAYHILKTEDAGQSWTSIDIPDLVMTDVEYLNGDTILALAYNVSTGKGALYWSYDAANNWTLGLELNQIASCFSVSGTRVLLGMYNRVGIYDFSTDSLAYVSNFIDENLYQYIVFKNIQHINDSIAYAAAEAQGATDFWRRRAIYKTEDGGQTWDLKRIHLDDNESTSLHFWNEEQGMYVGSKMENDTDVIHRTEDGGDTWQYISIPEYYGSVDLDFASDSVGFMTMGYTGIGWDHIFYAFSIFKTSDMGLSWQEEYLNEAGAPILSVDMISDSVAYVAGGFELIMKTENCGGQIDSIYPFYYFNVNSVEEKQTTNQGLIQLYPNPSSGEVYINLKDHLAEDLSVSVYNMNGQLLMQQEHVKANQTAINLSALPSALYIVQVKYKNQLVLKQLFIRDDY